MVGDVGHGEEEGAEAEEDEEVDPAGAAEAAKEGEPEEVGDGEAEGLGVGVGLGPVCFGIGFVVGIEGHAGRKVGVEGLGRRRRFWGSIDHSGLRASSGASGRGGYDSEALKTDGDRSFRREGRRGAGGGGAFRDGRG